MSLDTEAVKAHETIVCFARNIVENNMERRKKCCNAKNGRIWCDFNIQLDTVRLPIVEMLVDQLSKSQVVCSEN